MRAVILILGFLMAIGSIFTNAGVAAAENTSYRDLYIKQVLVLRDTQTNGTVVMQSVLKKGGYIFAGKEDKEVERIVVYGAVTGDSDHDGEHELWSIFIPDFAYCTHNNSECEFTSNGLTITADQKNHDYVRVSYDPDRYQFVSKFMP